MVSLRVVVFLLSSLLPLDAEETVLKCSIRPPPDVHVVPFKPQSPSRYEDCPAQNSTCYYFRFHGSTVSRDFPVHGCALFSKLPPQCKGGATFYEPNWSLLYRGVKFEGSIKCCGNDFCNEIEEAMFVPVHFNHDEATSFKKDFLFPILLTIFMVLVFSDHLKYFWSGFLLLFHFEEEKEEVVDEEQKKRGMNQTLKMNPASLALLPVEPTGEEAGKLEYTGPNVTGFFSSMHHMLEAIKEIEKWRPINSIVEKELRREERRTNKLKQKYGRDAYAKELSLNKNICNRQASEHADSRVFREIPTRLTDLLARLIEHGPYEFPFDPNELGDLFDKASEVLADESSVVDVDLGVHIIGNLEGSYIDLFRWFSIFGWPPKEKFVFLGGMVHPENPYSLEVISLLLALKIKLPNHVYIIRGYAEGQPLNMGERFPPRVSQTLREVAKKALNRLPLAVMINKQILCIHSSLPNRITTIEEINQIRRPLEKYHKESLEAHLFNAVPDSSLHLMHVIMNGENGENVLEFVDDAINGFLKKTSLMFLPKDLDDTAKRLKLDLIIRAKSVCEQGVSALADHVLCLWSAHCLSGAEAGAAIMVDTNGVLSITRLYKMGTFNNESTPVIGEVLETTLVEELENLEKDMSKKQDLDRIMEEGPVQSRMKMCL